MRKLIILLTTAIGAISLSSCGTTGYLASGYNDVDAIKDVVLFEPVSKIETIGKGEITVTNDTACVASQDLLLQTVKECESGLNILSVYMPSGEEEAEIVREGVESLYSQLLHSQGSFRTASFVVPESLDEIIERTGNRYGMAVYSYGFSRTGGNYAAQIAKGVGLAILTLGSVYTVPYKDKSNIHIFIIDSEQDCVAWHNHDIAADYNPLKQKHLEKQFKRIFRKFNK